MIRQVELEHIQQNPWQTRGLPPDGYIQELAEDIRQNGLLQTPIGRLTGTLIEEGIQLAFGHNRLAAFRWLNTQDLNVWRFMPVDIQKLSDEQMAMLAWSENERRRDLTPLERAKRTSRVSWRPGISRSVAQWRFCRCSRCRKRS
jgi:ParB/RepB/Spo0J family partition protein